MRDSLPADENDPDGRLTAADDVGAAETYTASAETRGGDAARGKIADGVIRRISWRDLCPWIELFRVFRVSISLQMLVLGFFGAWAMSVGWQLAGSVLLNQASLSKPGIAAVLNATVVWPGPRFQVMQQAEQPPSEAAPDSVDSDSAKPQPTDSSRDESAAGGEAIWDDWVLAEVATVQAAQADVVIAPDMRPISAGGVDMPNAGRQNGSTIHANSPAGLEAQAAAASNSTPTTTPTASPMQAAERVMLNVRTPEGSPWVAVTGIVLPFRVLLSGTLGWREFLFCLLGIVWNLIVWAIIGGAITRTAVVRLGRDERVGLRESLLFGASKFTAYIGSPLLPLVAILILAIPIMLLGFVMRLNLGIALASLLWLPAAVLGFTMALFAIGVLFGWPLMWSAISAEGSDSFDGISRAFAYTFQRPLHYLFYSAVALSLGLIGAAIVQIACYLIVQFTTLPAVFGMGAERYRDVEIAYITGESDSTLLSFGSSIVFWLNNCFLGIQRAYAYSFMWVASACIYLLLRRDADNTEFDAIFLEDDAPDNFGLPTLTPDASTGVPTAAATVGQGTAHSGENVDRPLKSSGEPDQPGDGPATA